MTGLKKSMANVTTQGCLCFFHNKIHLKIGEFCLLKIRFNKFSAENVLTWEIKLRQNVLLHDFFFPISLKYCSEIRGQYGQGSHWRMRGKETEFESVSTCYSGVSVSRGGKTGKCPPSLQQCAKPTSHQLACSQAAWSKVLLKLLHAAEPFQGCTSGI